ncbi:hypothetical protein [Desulfofustis glycolicus]|uniref:Lipoprotein n=1 Tax=Desulfofustis glycolicus DSM 9705 TaxID=1121409 RepID=A0A1M5YQB4_9BACT|nr:hypothetical protein [Desulfofustis glycolicus]SHI14054.1 hypothetical protein SAMN02745124_04314 [Desulfofustis glycolicus DSM 9705]
MKPARLLIALLVCVTAFNLGCVPKKTTETLRNVDQLSQHTRIATYLLSAHQQEALYRVGIYWDYKLGLNQNCTKDAQIKPGSLILLQPIVFPAGSMHPQAGAWQQRFEFERCEGPRTYNAIFLATPGSVPQERPLPSGNSNASLQLLHDAGLAAKMAASIKLEPQPDGKKCDEIQLVGTELTEPPHEVTKDGKTIQGAWGETWTMNGCGQVVTVNADFVPNDQGGTSFNFK